MTYFSCKPALPRNSSELKYKPAPIPVPKQTMTTFWNSFATPNWTSAQVALVASFSISTECLVATKLVKKWEVEKCRKI